jgi:hypothetical protein
MRSREESEDHGEKSDKQWCAVFGEGKEEGPQARVKASGFGGEVLFLPGKRSEQRWMW